MVWKWGLASNQILLAPESLSRLLLHTCQAHVRIPASRIVGNSAADALPLSGCISWSVHGRLHVNIGVQILCS